MNTLRNICTLVVLMLVAYYAFEYFMLWYNPAPPPNQPVMQERASRIIVADPTTGRDRVVWEKE